MVNVAEGMFSYRAAKRYYQDLNYEVPYFMASEFCLWLSDKIKIPIRLPKVEEFLQYLTYQNDKIYIINKYKYIRHDSLTFYNTWCYHQLTGKVDTLSEIEFDLANKNFSFKNSKEPSIFLIDHENFQNDKEIDVAFLRIAFDAKYIKIN
jgi:hypothetical protein